MKENLISFGAAKLAKEKGFVEYCHSYYFEDGEFRENKIETTNGYYGEEVTYELEEFEENWNGNLLTRKNGDRCFGCSKSYGYMETYSAPTQSLLQKWLREKKNLHITIHCIRCHIKINDIIGYQYTIEGNFFQDTDDTFTTFEEALEEGLKQALSLIENKIEKNGK